jgi:hypothetical protein
MLKLFVKQKTQTKVNGPQSSSSSSSSSVKSRKPQTTLPSATRAAVEQLEVRRLLANWSWQDQLIGLDKETQNYPGINGSGETVVLIDRGVDYNHYALGNGYGKKVVTSWNFDNNTWDVYPYDNDAHGTGSAGEIAADPHYVNGQLYQGVAPGAKLIALKARGSWEVKEAMDWVISHKSQYNIVAVNWVDPTGGSDSNQFLSEEQTLKSMGVFVGGPSGNYGPGPAYPTPGHGYYQAGSSTLNDQLSYFTPRGSGLDLVAPGDNVMITWYANGQHMDYPSSGTSWAGPQMVGAAALIKQVNPNFTPDQIMQIMRDSANWIWDSTSGQSYPRLNVNNAVALAYQRSGQAPTPTGGGKSTPFSGTPIAVGNVIKAGYYDQGGEGVAYHDTTSWNESGINFRGDGEDVGWTNADGGGAYVGWTHTGEWINYTVNAASAGSYTLQMRVAAAGNGGYFHVEVDGQSVTGSMNIPNTGSWDTYTTLSKAGVWLNAGQHVVRVVMDSNGQYGFTGNFLWYNFVGASNTAAPAAATGNASGYTPVTSTVPNGPYGLTFANPTKSSLNLNFVDNANNESAYVIERADTLGGAYKVVGTIQADANMSAGTGWRSWTDYSLGAGTTYYYRVKATNQIGDSAYAWGTATTTWS